VKVIDRATGTADTTPGVSDALDVAGDRDERSVIVTLARGVSVRRVGVDDVVVTAARGELPLGGLPPGIARALERLERGSAADSLEDDVIGQHGLEGLAHWYALVASLEAAACLRYVVRSRGQVVAAYTPAAEGSATMFVSVTGGVRLSRFAHMRRDGDALIIDSPLARGRVELHDPRLAGAVAAMSVPMAADALSQTLAGMARDCVDPLLSLLVAAGMILPVDDDGTTREDRSDAARCWEFADLVLHARSRTSRVDLRVGGTYRFEGESEPLPPFKPEMTGARIALVRPGIAELSRSDVPFTRVVEERRSIRRHGEPPIDLARLGEFLYRVARARPRRETGTRLDDDASHPNASRFRVYPGGGACHPLEIYPVVGRCVGLEGGLYHYDPERHELEALASPDGAVARLLRTTSVPTDDGAVPQTLLVLTARFRRLSWKYEGNAYALLLQEVGVVYQTMYLVATAMGLAPCAVGGGDAARFARIIGTDPLEEASVGAFVLGSASPAAR
jgi:SagB-type dehydrogenase family enzyme